MPERILNELDLVCMALAAIMGALGAGGAVGAYALREALRQQPQHLSRALLLASTFFGVASGIMSLALSMRAGLPLAECAAWALAFAFLNVGMILGLSEIALFRLLRRVLERVTDLPDTEEVQRTTRPAKPKPKA